MATHCSISRYVTSLLAPKSHSSRHEQNASLIAQSLSFAYTNNGFHSSARWPRSSGLRPCGGAGIPIPSDQNANINGITRCRDSSSISEVPYHCHMQGKQYKNPTTRSTSQKYQSIVTQKIQQKFLHIGKCLGTPMFYITEFYVTILLLYHHDNVLIVFFILLEVHS